MMVSALKQIVFRRFSHPLYPTLIFPGMGAWLSALVLSRHPMNPASIGILFLVGVLSWTLVEYLLHRFVFHWVEVAEPWRTMFSGLHMAHHEAPDSSTLIVAPPVVSFTFATLFFLIFWTLTQNLAAAALLITGLFTGYCIYEWVHFATHQYAMTSRLGRVLKKYHLQHHHKHPNKGFGVTSPFWDRVFGTFPPEN